MATNTVLLTKCATKNATISATQSTTLVKNLFRAAFSSVAYIRDFFEDDCFQIGKIGTTRYHKIVNVERDDVKRFVDWLELGVFDALQKRYLDVVILEVYEELVPKKSKKRNAGKRKLVECYTFTVTFIDGKAQLAMTGSGDGDLPEYSKEHIKKTTGEVLRSLVQLTSSLDSLPANRIISMKLLYTEDTPEEYEPPLFCKAPDNGACWFEDSPLRMDAGVVSTPYHEFSMTIQARNKTAGKVNRPRDDNGKGEDRVDGDKPGKRAPVKTQKKGGKSNKEWDNEGATVIDVGCSDANSSRVGKECPANSEVIQVDAAKSHKFNLQKREGDATMKNARGQQIEEDPKVSGWGPSARKRKTSKADKDIAGRRRKTSA